MKQTHRQYLSFPPCIPSTLFMIDIIQLMTRKLSQAFFGDKKFTEKVYGEVLSSGELRRADIEMIFEPYTSKLQGVQGEHVGLLDIFVEFIQGTVQEFGGWPFQKLSSVVEIAAHVFQHSFEQWLEREESFQYFSDVLVRHSLFRPPHSVCIFNYEELNQITTWWLTHFDRYYEEYRYCMASSLNELLITCALPTDTQEPSIPEGKLVDKSEAIRYLQ